MTVLVTGGAGFIASNFLHHICLKGYDDVVVLDKLTYAGDYENIRDLPITFYQTDIADEHNCEFIFKKTRKAVFFYQNWLKKEKLNWTRFNFTHCHDFGFHWNLR